MQCSLLTNGLFFYPEENNSALNKPCCTFGTSKLESRKNMTEQMDRLSIHDTQNFLSDSYRKLQIRLLGKGQKVEACNSCWKHEKVGYPSMRTRVNELNIADDSGKLKYLELNSGNTCNIKCIMCNPSDSLTTKKYYDYVGDTFPNLMETTYKKNRVAKHRGLLKSDIDLIEWNHFNKLEFLKVTGGETFYTKEFWYFLEKLIENGMSSNITLIVVTNNTVQLDDNKINIFKKFKRIKIYSSVDGIGDLCDTVRAGSKWNIVEDNIKHLIELNKEYPDKFLHTEPHSVIQFANILQLDELVDWWSNIALTEEFKNKHYLRILDQPRWYEIGKCTSYIKQEAIKKYKDNKKLNHVAKYLESSPNDDEYNVKYTLPIFEETCRLNNQNPFSSKAYEVIKNA